MVSSRSLSFPPSDSPSRADAGDAALVSLFPKPAWVKVAIVYDDGPAGRRAMRAFGEFDSENPDDLRLCPVLWRFDRLERLMLRCRALDDVVEADIVMVSLSHPRNVPPIIASWLAGCLHRKQSNFISVMTLLGSVDDGMIALRRDDAEPCVTLQRVA